MGNTLSKVMFESIAATVAFGLIALSAHVLLEPIFQETYAATSQFTTTQTITSEISFLTAPSNITMSPAIAGLTGGAATGSTQVVIYTNNSTGYLMTITASGSPSMRADTTGGFINDYTPASAGVPDFSFVNNSSGQASEFGFTVSASNTADLAQKFLDNGSTCNTGSSDTSGINTCWTFASTTATTTIVTSAQTSNSGSTSTIFFHTNVPASPSPALTEDTYVATTTLTAVTN